MGFIFNSADLSDPFVRGHTFHFSFSFQSTGCASIDSGFAFVMSNGWPNATGKTYGYDPSSHVVGIVFDAVANQLRVTGVQNGAAMIRSLPATTALGAVTHVWVMWDDPYPPDQYDVTWDLEVEVYVSQSNTQPVQPWLMFSYRDLVKQVEVNGSNNFYVGFTSGTGNNPGSFNIHSWCYTYGECCVHKLAFIRRCHFSPLCSSHCLQL